MSAEPVERMSYVGYCGDCGGMIAAAVDSPDRRKGKDGTAKLVADLMREGHTIARVTCQFVRDNLNGCTAECPCTSCEKKRATKAAEQANDDQFSVLLPSDARGPRTRKSRRSALPGSLQR